MPGELALSPFFSPQSVAVIGASTTKGKAGHFLLKNLVDGGYRGRLYPVNPAARRVLGVRAYASIQDIRQPVDLAFIVVPTAHVAGVVRECARRKVKAVMIVTAGFAETGEAGRTRQGELSDIIRASRMRAVGPNSVGLVSAPDRLMGSFVPFPDWPVGSVAIAAQTGIFTGAFADQLAASTIQRLGMSRSICLGNTIDVDEVDFLEFAGQDPQTNVVALHLESFNRARAFLSAANRVSRSKPIVVLKTGRTLEGAKAAASHSGALAAQDRVVDAAFRQFGIVRAHAIDEFEAIARAFAWQPLPRGNRVGVVTLSGALGVMAVDELQGTGLTLAGFSPHTVEALERVLPTWQPVRNPADVWVALGDDPGAAHERILNAVIADPAVDMVLAILLPIPNADFAAVRRMFERLRRRHGRKPLLLVFMGGRVKQRWLREIEPLHVPVYSDTRLAVRAMAAMSFAAAHRARQRPDPMASTSGRPH